MHDCKNLWASFQRFESFQTSVMRDEQRSALLLFNAIVVQLQKGIELSISFIALELTESFVDVAADATQRQNSQIIKPQYKYHHTEKHQKSILAFPIYFCFNLWNFKKGGAQINSKVEIGIALALITRNHQLNNSVTFRGWLLVVRNCPSSWLFISIIGSVAHIKNEEKGEMDESEMLINAPFFPSWPLFDAEITHMHSLFCFMTISNIISKQNNLRKILKKI